jgi:hypothetical protein
MATHNTSIDARGYLLGMSLTLMAWPLLNMYGFAVLKEYEIRLNTGAGIIQFLLGALSCMIGVVSFILYCATRKPSHPPIQFERVLAWSLAGTLLGSVLTMGLLAWPDYCMAGACPDRN